MFRPALPLFVAAATILLPANDSLAQGGRAGGGGLGGASSFGSSSMGGGFGGQSAFGGSSFGQSGLGQSGFGLGQSSFGQSAFGQSAFGAGQQGGSFGAQGGNQAFIGRSAADMASFFGGAANQAGQNTQRGQRSGGGSNRGSSSSSSSTQTEVRVAITASPELQRFVAANRPPAAVAISNVSRALERKGVDGVTLIAADGVAVLEGFVATPADKLLAEKLASIEPGVRRVDNRLVVQAVAEEILPEPQ
ncbi:BON domain-containing protein [Botrimarina mediterranea]|uniref:BON domain-containing protein n=1 Tax=Botrimarina mediterranea TaxID=2528022 RepID=UPI00118A7E8C|nr:BON domain protein [Planctomycetes bacterium K2D]